MFLALLSVVAIHSCQSIGIEMGSTRVIAPSESSPSRSTQGQPLTLDIRGTRMLNLAPQLAQAFGEPVAFPPYMKNVPLMIRVKDVPAEELRRRIAWCLNATWEHDKDGWRLLQTPTQKREEEQLSYKLRLAKVTEALARAKKLSAKIEPFTPQRAETLVTEIAKMGNLNVGASEKDQQAYFDRLRKLTDQKPEAKLALMVALALTPEMVASVNSDNPVQVFSSRPTPLQAPFNRNLAMAFEQYRTELVMWISACKSYKLKHPEAFDNLDNVDYSPAYDLSDEEMPEVPDTVQLEVNELDGAITVELRTYDREGGRIFDLLVLTAGLEQASEEGDPEVLPKPKLSPEAEELLRVSSESGYQVKPSPELFQKLIRPDIFDPTSFILTDLVASSAERSNVVAVLPLDGILWANYFIETSPEIKSRHIVQRDDRWYLLKPSDPILARKHEVDRDLLAKVIKSIMVKSYFTLDEDAALAYALPRGPQHWFSVYLWLRTLRTTVAHRYLDAQMLRIWATLPEPLKKSGESIARFSDLPLQAQQEIGFYYYQDTSINRSLHQFEPTRELPKTPAINKLLEQAAGGLVAVPTNGHPNGISGDALFRVSVKEEEVIVIPTNDLKSGTRVRFMAPESLGKQLFERTLEGARPGLTQQLLTDKIQLGTKKTVTMSLQVQGILGTSWLMVKHLAPDPNYLTISQLPPSVRDRIQKGFDRAKKEANTQKDQSSGGAGDIPPSPK